MAGKYPKKKLGILGGMGPAASAEFMRILAQRAPASVDQDHAVMYLLSDPHIPDRTAAFYGTGEDPTERLRQDLLTVAGWGADILAVPCNTAHVFIDKIRHELPVPFLHIVEETIAACKRKSPKGAWLTATEGTCRSGLYQSYAKKMDYTFREVPADMQIDVTLALTLVKEGKMTEAGACMRGVVERLWKIEDIPVATACTELPLAYDASGLPPERSVSSLGALADACLAAIHGDDYTLS